MKKGFTLVELLAVIVILSIILVIAVPKVQDIIENVKEETFKTNIEETVSQLKRIYQDDYLEHINSETTTYTALNGVWTSNGITIDAFDGKKELNGEVIIDSNGKVSLSLNNEIYCATKTFESDIEVSLCS